MNIQKALREVAEDIHTIQGKHALIDLLILAADRMDDQEKRIHKLEQSVQFYKRRVVLLQEWQSKMRDPERTIVCDILANGQTLPLEYAGDRYSVIGESK